MERVHTTRLETWVVLLLAASRCRRHIACRPSLRYDISTPIKEVLWPY